MKNVIIAKKLIKIAKTLVSSNQVADQEGEYTNFTNCSYTSNQKYSGIKCHKKDIPYTTTSGSSQKYTGDVLLLSNDEIHVTIDGYDVGNSYSEGYKRQPIQSSNVGN